MTVHASSLATSTSIASSGSWLAQNQFRHHIGATYVAVEDDGTVLGFATVAAGHIEIEDLPKTKGKKLPHYSLPIIRLARLAVDRAAQGRGVGKLLLRAVFQIARDTAESVGCVGVVVDAKPEAIAFYERYGFERFEVIEGALDSRPQPLPMFVPLDLIPRRLVTFASRFDGVLRGRARRRPGTLFFRQATPYQRPIWV